MWRMVLAAVIGAGLGIAAGEFAPPYFRSRLGADLFFYVTMFAGGILGVVAWSFAQRPRG
jgi:hypothetical protein